MACCAFAIFLVTQMLAPFTALARKLGLASQWRPDPAVEWRPGVAAPKVRKPRKWARIGLGVLALDAGILALISMPAAASLPADRSSAIVNAQLEAKIHASICGRLGVSEQWRP